MSKDAPAQDIRGAHREPRDPDRQTAEIHIRIALINRFNALGPPRSLAWPDATEETESHASNFNSATTPDHTPKDFEMNRIMEEIIALADPEKRNARWNER